MKKLNQKMLQKYRRPLTNSIPTKHQEQKGYLYKHGGTNVTNAIYGLITKIWEEEKLPIEWKTSINVLIYKNQRG